MIIRTALNTPMASDSFKFMYETCSVLKCLASFWDSGELGRTWLHVYENAFILAFRLISSGVFKVGGVESGARVAGSKSVM